MNTATDIFDTMTADPRWLGAGYLGERNNTVDVAARDLLDEFLPDHFESLGWTDEDVFAWANSKDGRWFGDVMFGRGDSDLVGTFEREGVRLIRKQVAA